MDRRHQGLIAKSASAARSAPRFSLFVSTALVSVALAGCTASAPPAESSFAKAQAALSKGNVDSAIGHAEAAVLAEPRNASFRAMLGAAYLDAGRFTSAAQAFGDALELGEDDPRTVLSYALAKVATGDNAAALAQLAANERSLQPADLGLAIALAGQPERGVHYLVNSVRNGGTEDTAKARQNLAYAYALAGNWRAARVMAAEDVPADQLDARLSQWASLARSEDYQARVANLLGVTPVSDDGQPQHLALANFPSQPMMVAEAAAQVEDAAPAKPRASEAMAFGIRDIDTAEVKAAPAPVAASAPVARPAAPVVAAAAPVLSGPRFVSNEVVQKTPAVAQRAPAPVAKPAPTPVRAASPSPQQRMAVATGAADTHRVQLGSFDTREVAEAKWDDFVKRFPQLKAHDLIITEARVNGRTFYRVAAAGFGSRSARSMCSAVKSSGRGCFAYAATNPPAGAVDNGVRVASRSR